MRLVLAALGLSACCNGPFVYVDCVASGIEVEIVDTVGVPVVADSVIASVDGEDRGEQCREPCSSAFVFTDVEGTWDLTVTVGEQVVTQTVEVEFPRHRAGQCCSDVFQHTEVVEVDPVG